MKFKKKIEICREDDDTPMRLFHKTQKGFKLRRDCCHVEDGICTLDKKKCKIITYVRED